MKLVFYLATLLIVSSFCEAYSRARPVNVTRRFEREINLYFSHQGNQAVSEIKKYRVAIQSNVQSYSSEYSKLRERIGRELSQLGPQGRMIAADVKGLIDSVKATTNQKAILSKAQQVLSYVKANYIDPLKADLDSLKNAVVENSNAIECWDDNKAALKVIMNSVAGQVKSAIDSNQKKLHAKTEAVVAKIGAAVARIETQIRSTCTSTDCVVDYFDKNYASLLAEFTGNRDEIVAAINAAVIDTLVKANAALNDASAGYKPLRDTIKACIASKTITSTPSA